MYSTTSIDRWEKFETNARSMIMFEYVKENALYLVFARHKHRVFMCLLLLGAAGVMIIQHFFYRYLHHKPTDYVFFGNPSFSTFLRQYYISIGNVLSLTAKACLCTALAFVFIQVFWLLHSRKRYTVDELDVALACKNGSWPALMSIRQTTLLSTLTFIAAAMVVITIFAPGAVKPDTTSFPRPCQVPTVDLTNAWIALQDPNYVSPIAQLRGFVNQVLLSGTYMTPKLVQDSDDLDGSLSYNITFDAPSFDCINVTSSFDFATNLPSPPTAANISITDKILVWNSTRSINPSDGSLSITVATRKLLPTFDGEAGVKPDAFPTATNCTAYLGTYTVLVSTGSVNLSLPFVSINNIVYKSPLSVFSSDDEQIQYYAIADTLVGVLNGTVTYDPITFDFTPGSLLAGYSPLGAADPDTPWTWNVEMQTALPQVMQNVSLSFLSDKLSGVDTPTLKFVHSTCQDRNIYFIYEPLRLFLVYGVCLFITGVCIVLGFVAIYANGVEESLSLPRILHALSGGRGDYHPIKDDRKFPSEDETKLLAAFGTSGK